MSLLAERNFLKTCAPKKDKILYSLQTIDVGYGNLLNPEYCKPQIIQRDKFMPFASYSNVNSITREPRQI